jgi:hypothetical protein
MAAAPILSFCMVALLAPRLARLRLTMLRHARIHRASGYVSRCATTSTSAASVRRAGAAAWAVDNVERQIAVAVGPHCPP